MAFQKLKVVVSYVAGALALVVALWLNLERQRYPKLFAGLIPLRVSLNASGAAKLSASFEAIWSEPHYLAIIFPTKSDDQDIDTILDTAQNAVGSRQNAMPAFDIEWSVFDGSSVVGQGSGQQKPTAILGGGSTRGFVFGEFPARAGRVYRVNASFGQDFERFLRASPVFEVGVFSATPSVGLVWVRDLYGPLTYLCGFVGVLLLGSGVLLSTRAGGRLKRR